MFGMLFGRSGTATVQPSLSQLRVQMSYMRMHMHMHMYTCKKEAPWIFEHEIAPPISRGRGYAVQIVATGQRLDRATAASLESQSALLGICTRALRNSTPTGRTRGQDS